jgi:hypothetical protein
MQFGGPGYGFGARPPPPPPPAVPRVVAARAAAIARAEERARAFRTGTHGDALQRPIAAPPAEKERESSPSPKSPSPSPKPSASPPPPPKPSEPKPKSRKRQKPSPPPSSLPKQPPPPPPPPPETRKDTVLGKSNEQQLAADGHKSVREAEATQYTLVLRNGANGVPGIMAANDADGKALIEFKHQRQAVKRAIDDSCRFMLLAHDAGLGKTATLCQIIAAMELLKLDAHGVPRGGVRVVISIPPSTMDQVTDCVRTWLKIPSEKVLATNRTSHVTREALLDARIVIVTRHLVGRLFKLCHEQRIPDRAVGEPVARKGAWVRKRDVPLHPLFAEEMEWDLLAVDEAHFMRNSSTEWCVSHALLARVTKKRIAMTATPVFNDPNDMRGLCKCIGANERDYDPNGTDFTAANVWTGGVSRLGGGGGGSNRSKVNLATIARFKRHTDRVRESILNLPKLTNETFSFDPGLPDDVAKRYNEVLTTTQNIRIEIDRSSKQSVEEFKRLMHNLQIMQQILVSPRLAERGAEYYKENPDEYDKAAANDTGALLALVERIRALRADGHARMIVASAHVAQLRIGLRYVKRHVPDMELLAYDGSLSIDARTRVKRTFLEATASILFLSIAAGGTGLHLVPGCNAMIFWGSRPFSPAQVLQCSRRIYRIGQEFPVRINHVIAKGSVDYAIERASVDKKNLGNAVLDGDFSFTASSASTTLWKTTRRIVDCCYPIDADGKFADPTVRVVKRKEPPSLKPSKPSGEPPSLKPSKPSGEPPSLKPSKPSGEPPALKPCRPPPVAHSAHRAHAVHPVHRPSKKNKHLPKSVRTMQVEPLPNFTSGWNPRNFSS